MGRHNSMGPPLPPRVRAAFDYLDHVRVLTTQFDTSIPARELSPLEQSVHAAALRALQQYLLGEMDFAEPTPARKASDRGGEDGAPSGCPK